MRNFESYWQLAGCRLTGEEKERAKAHFEAGRQSIGGCVRREVLEKCVEALSQELTYEYLTDCVPGNGCMSILAYLEAQIGTVSGLSHFASHHVPRIKAVLALANEELNRTEVKPCTNHHMQADASVMPAPHVGQGPELVQAQPGPTDEQYFEGLEQHVKEGNEVFDKAIARMSEDTKQPGPSAVAVEAAEQAGYELKELCNNWDKAWRPDKADFAEVVVRHIQSAMDKVAAQATAPLAQEVERLKQHAVNLVAAYEATYKERDQLRTDLATAQRELEALKSASSESSDWCPLCKQGWDCAKEDQKSRVEINRLQRELAEAKEEHFRMMERTGNTHEDLASCRASLEQEKAKSEQDALAHFQTEQKLKAERSQLTSVVEEQRQEIDVLKVKLAELERERNILLQFKTIWNRCNAERSKLKEEIEALRKCVADVSDLDNTKLALEAVRKDLDNWRSTANKANERDEQKRQEIERLRRRAGMSRDIQQIIRDMKAVADDFPHDISNPFIFEAIEALAEHSHKPVLIADVVTQILREERAAAEEQV